MEEAPLTLAHSHARKAAVETSKSHLAVAATEHLAAAEQYAKAQPSTSDPEALRMLNLLEEHHRQLAHIIRSKHTIAKAVQDAEHVDSLELDPSAAIASPPIAPSSAPPPPVARVHPSRRESSPALAKDIATRRGIPQQPSLLNPRKPVPSTTTSTTPSVDRRTPSTSVSPATSTQSKDQDDGFSRFYSNWTTGPLSRLSSILAFTALPLTDTPEPDSPTSSRHQKTSARASNDPDVKNLISPAALNALQQHGHIGPGESFYVIPTSGGTASYANIVTREQRYARRQHLSNISEDDPAEFVDAQETQSAKQPNRGLISEREEELQLQNDTLKQALDHVSHRLQAFESHAQDASMAALTHSVASVRTTHSAVPSSTSRQSDDELQAALKEIKRLEHDNAKFRAYYSKLKDSAKARRAESKG
ncbi:unnamed protein product [Aureobasidium mustum]|uniref:Uncharacterized protein n=1 Tax=Aureobasidium mustum TaxID=2773714 RepID=A0A9N8PMR3_9PEZI|nr:unnamed protein product [Aureobasidium mustum]